ncbi:MAG: G1 family glutamic endopeptidase [Acidimicrobiales bacterium]
MRKVFLSGALALIGLAAPAALALTPAATAPAAAASAPTHAAVTPGTAVPGLYHVPIIGKVTLPGALGSLLGGRNANGLRRATAVQSSNWAGYADTNDTFNSVASSWTEPTVNCANSNSGLDGILGLSTLDGLLGGPGAASAFWVGLDGYNSTSVEQLGTDSDCDSGSPSYYAWYEMYPNPSVTLPSQYPVQPGDHLTALVSANSAGTSFTLMIKDSTAGWTFSTTQTGSGFARSSAEVIAEAPSSCSILFCSEVPLADFGQVDYSGSSVIDSAGTKGSLASFDANEITMSDNGTTLATPSSLSSDGSSFSVAWNAS